MGQGSGNVSNVVQYGGGAITSTTANGVPPQITIPLSNLSSMVTLMGGVGSNTASNYYGFYSASSPASQAQYQVPGGKTLYILGIYVSTGSSAVTQLGYGTAALASEGTGTPPTGVIYYSASSTVATAGQIGTAASPAYTYFPVGASFPASSYPFWRNNGSGVSVNMIMIGILQ